MVLLPEGFFSCSHWIWIREVDVSLESFISFLPSVICDRLKKKRELLWKPWQLLCQSVNFLIIRSYRGVFLKHHKCYLPFYGMDCFISPCPFCNGFKMKIAYYSQSSDLCLKHFLLTKSSIIILPNISSSIKREQ